MLINEITCMINQLLKGDQLGFLAVYLITYWIYTGQGIKLDPLGYFSSA